MEGISSEKVLMTDLLARTEDKESDETNSDTIACLAAIDNVSEICSRWMEMRLMLDDCICILI